MTGRLLFTARARADLIQIVTAIGRDNPAAAERFLGRLEHTSRLLAEQPGMGHGHRDVRRKDFRCFGVGPYLVFYREIPGGIEVVRYVHGRRDLRRAL